MTFVYIGIAVWTVAIVINLAGYKIAKRRHRNTAEADLYYDRLHRERDELEARRRTRPSGNCQVIRGPWVREEPTLPPTVGPFDRSGGAA